MRFKILLSISICFSLYLQGCLRTIEIPVLGDASGAILKVSQPIKSGNTQTFTINVHVVDASGNQVNNLTKNNFAILDTISNPYGMKYSILNVKGGNKTDFKGDYSSFLLLDQSGSTDDTDPNNLRIKASQIFLDALGKNDNVALGSFTTTSNYDFYNGYTLLHGGFTNDGSSFFPALDSLEFLISKGGTPLFTSIDWSLNYTNKNAKSKNKAVIVFTDGINTGSSSIENVEKNSLALNIPIFTVGLSEGVSFDVLNRMALNTGGTFMWAKDAKQLISYFGTLGNLLRGNAEYYTITIQTTADSFPSNNRVFFLKVTLNNGKKFLIPFVIKFV